MVSVVTTTRFDSVVATLLMAATSFSGSFAGSSSSSLWLSSASQKRHQLPYETSLGARRNSCRSEHRHRTSTNSPLYSLARHSPPWACASFRKYSKSNRIDCRSRERPVTADAPLMWCSVSTASTFSSVARFTISPMFIFCPRSSHWRHHSPSSTDWKDACHLCPFSHIHGTIVALPLYGPVKMPLELLSVRRSSFGRDILRRAAFRYQQAILFKNIANTRKLDA